jgi:hypothetical protein
VHFNFVIFCVYILNVQQATTDAALRKTDSVAVRFLAFIRFLKYDTARVREDA